MNFDRRSFLKAGGTLALAGLTGGIGWGADEQTQMGGAGGGAQPKKTRVGILDSSSIAITDGPIIPVEEWFAREREFELIRFNPAEAGRVLNPRNVDIYVHLSGNMFIPEIFEALERYLKGGGRWLNTFGMPLSVQIGRVGDKSIRGHKSTYLKRLGITAFHRVHPSDRLRFEYTESAAGVIQVESELAEILRGGDFAALQMPLTRTKFRPDEDGSDGPREIELQPMIHGIDTEGIPRVAPWVKLVHHDGLYKRSVWSFVTATTKGSMTRETTLAQVRDLMQPVLRLEVFPKRALITEKEEAEFQVIIRSPELPRARLDASSMTLSIREFGGMGTVSTHQLAPNILSGEDGTFSGTFKVAHRGSSAHRYQVKLEFSGAFAIGTAGTAFIIGDVNPVLPSAPITAGPTHFEREGKPFPVCGTTYMSSTTHRRFLVEPTADRWDTDFKAMKAAGVNMVRTGIWTGWKEISEPSGAANEAILRNFGAYLITANQYDIPVIFTFFAFLPETWASDQTKTNAFFDPAAIAKQKSFVRSFVERFSGVTNVLWDFINEPSFSSPAQLWSCRPNYDQYEVSAWRNWLALRYDFPNETDLRGYLGALYGVPSESALELPPLADFSDTNIIGNASWARVVDYRLFAQESFAFWTREMVDVVRKAGGTKQLVTVGQDEGGTAGRPSPHFFAKGIDFTSVHNWWYNNDLIWDNVMTGTAGRPHLVEETGVMYYENEDGSPLRTETEVADLLERKMAVAHGAGTCGFIQWIWNTNPYMPSDNEAAIGLFRIDGTAKPELDRFRAMARFINANKHLMVGRSVPKIAMIIPHSNLYSPRNTADEATRNCVKALTSLGHQVQGISEYSFRHETCPQKFLFLPAPGRLNNAAWDEILKAVQIGSIVITSGYFEMDEHAITSGRFFGGTLLTPRSVGRTEALSLDDSNRIEASFSGEKIHRLNTVTGKWGEEKTLWGNGRYWIPFPLENADSIEPVIQTYSHILSTEGLRSELDCPVKPQGVTILPTKFASALLVTIINESGEAFDGAFTVRSLGVSRNARVPAGRAAMAFLDLKTGAVLDSLGDIS